MSNINKNTILKLLGILLLGTIGLWLIYTQFFGSGYGVSMGRSNGLGHMYFTANTGIGAAGGGGSSILLPLTKILLVLSIIGLIIGVLKVVMVYVFTEEDIQKIKGIFTFERTVITKEACKACGKELNDEWVVCPFCGNLKEIKNEQMEA